MNLQSLGTKYGISQELLADKLGVAEETIARWESGKNPVPTKHLRDLAILLETSVADLVASPSSDQAGDGKPHSFTDDTPYGTVALAFVARSRLPRDTKDGPGEYIEGASHYYPISEGERSRLRAQLRGRGASSRWLNFKTLDNRYVFINPAALDSIQMLGDDVVELPDYEHEETYKAIAAILRRADGTGAENPDGDSSPYSRRLIETCRELIEEWGGEDAADGRMNDLVVERLDGERLSLPIEDQVIHELDLVAEGTTTREFVDLYSEGYDRATFFRLGALRLVEAPALRYHEAFETEGGEAAESQAHLSLSELSE